MKTTLGLLVLAFPLICIADVVVPVDEVENFVNVRQAPEAGSEIVGRLQKGIPLKHVASVEGWHEVVLDDEGTTGFVSADWSVIVPDEPAPDAVEAAAAEEAVAQEAVAEQAVVVEAVVQQEVEEAVAGDPVADETAATLDDEIVAEVSAGETDEVVMETGEETVNLAAVGAVGAAGPPGPPGPAGPPGPPGDGAIKGKPGFLVRFKDETVGESSQVFDNGNQVGIGTTEPTQRLEVNGNIQINEQSSNVAGLMITQASGDTGYVMHNAAGTLTIGAGSIDRITIDRDGNVGIGESRPSHPLEMASGAHVTAGGVWTNNSSREDKENISELTLEEALAALAALEPVRFSYRSEQGETYNGFIAEDVPDLVATGDRQGLSTMDIVAVLTRVIQEQQRRIEQLEARIAD